MMISLLVVNGKYIGYDDISSGNEEWRKMAKDKDWEDRVKGLLKAELKRRNVGYRDLAEKLEALGVKDSERNIANKISRGGFTAVFFVQCLVAVGAHTLRLEELS
jgi:hypothetical protein